MATCDQCGAEENLPYQCRHCGGTYCSEHRLPENHDCPGLKQWNDPQGVFDSGFDDTVRDDLQDESSGLADRLPVDTGPGGFFAYFRGNVTFLFLALMWATFMLQWIVRITAPELYRPLFVLHPNAITNVWTWFTSVFAHGLGFFHIAINSMVLYFFGPIVERRVGSKKFAILFLASGALAGLAQVGTSLVLYGGGNGVVGASGAIMAIMGVLTVLNPHLRVYLWFVIPMPLWVLTIGFALFSVFLVGAGGIGSGGVAHLAHLAGLFVGVGYGEKVKRDGARAPEQLRFGGGGPGPGGPGGRRRF
ncbi:rhomboid family intramembrane serine protease [Halobacteriales archaeon QS_1_68_20]|nr:MAG: rhomboid family intramembrane serine protease [Halobacteriales archaeon QS_1_68_20]